MINLDRLNTEKFLGCGCSTFGGSTSKSVALKTLDFCFDNGIEYYDVARSYGYGQAESILGKFLKDKREKVIITSKFGIEAPKTFPLRSLATTLARFAKKHIPHAHNVLKSASGQILKKQPFTPQTILSSLEKSLLELRTTYLDLFIYHEASFELMLNDDVKNVLIKAQDSGKIRSWGFNISDEDDQAKILMNKIGLDVLQLPLSLSKNFTDLTHRSSQINVVYSVMRLYESLDSSIKRKLLKIIENNHKQVRFENELETILYFAYHSMASGVVLMSTTNTSHITRNIKIASIKMANDRVLEEISNVFVNSPVIF